jgi:hypothetical protein
MWVYVTYGPGYASRIAFGAMSRVHPTSIFVFSVETHKLEVAPKPWDRNTKIGKIPAGEAGVAQTNEP